MSGSERRGANGRMRFRTLMAFLASASAIVLSLVSLSVAISANRTQERLLAASVWPTLQYGTGNRGEDGADVVSFSVGNGGVGPARLRTFQLRHEDQYLPDAVALLRKCCGFEKGSITTVTSGTRARVLRAGEDVTFLRFPREGNPAGVWEQLNRERFRVEVLACYCSVLGDCWLLDTRRTEPEPIATCPVVPESEQWHG